MLILLAAAFTAARATHEVDHRYTVAGEVRTTDGRPLAGETVKITVAEGTVIKQARTDTFGRYRITLHLHNADLGKVFDLVVRDQTRRVRVLFNPGDNKTERGQRLDFEFDDELTTKERQKMVIVPEPS